MLAICRYHRNSNGWNDIGYNALVDKYGVLYEGRAGGLDQPVIGAQAQGFNSETAGIASIGDHTSVGRHAGDARRAGALHPLEAPGAPAAAQRAGDAAQRGRLGSSVRRRRAGDGRARDRPSRHRAGRPAPASCCTPSSTTLRAMVASGVATVPSAATRLSATLADYRSTTARSCRSPGCCPAPTARPLPGEQVEVQVNGDGRWVTSRRVLSAADGTFATELKPRKRMYVRMRFPGRPELGGAFSTRLLLRLRPVIDVQRARKRARRWQTVPVKGTVGPRKRFLRLVVQQHVSGALPHGGREDRAGAPRALRDLVRAGLPGSLPLRAWSRSRTTTRTAGRPAGCRCACASGASPALLQVLAVEAVAGGQHARRLGEDAAGRAAASGARRTRRPARSAPATAARCARSPAPSR